VLEVDRLGALGIDIDGVKHPLALVEGSTEVFDSPVIASARRAS
jgi:hypothetical protein